MKCELRLPDQERFFANIRENANACVRVAEVDSRKGKTVAICGSGPSLVDAMEPTAHDWYSEVWACNSALPTLWDWGIRPTHGVSVDQNLGLIEDSDFGRRLPVEYYLISAIHPDVVAHLDRVTFFHSLQGIPDPEGWTPPENWPGALDPKGNRNRSHEMWLYTTLYPVSIMAGHGLNSVPRAVCLALGMGFDHITVFGADCACAVDSPPMPSDGDAYLPWLDAVTMYADGRTAAVYGDFAMAEAVIDGRRWVTRPDMVISAIHLLQLEGAFPGCITLVGDTLPNAIRHKDNEWFKTMPNLDTPGVVSNFGTVGV